MMDVRKCNLCPRECGINREDGEVGFCGARDKIEISWYGLHFGEEPTISDKEGSGTIFFCHCNLKCVFCQNWQISQEVRGCRKTSPLELVKIMFELQEEGANNINLVSPTIWSYWIKEAILGAKEKGLKIPIVWNSNAYESVAILEELEGLVDVYLPDFKYSDDNLAVKYSSAPNYSTVAKKAIFEMQRQVGDLEIDENELTRKGLIVRHLVLPNCRENTKESLKFIRSVSSNVHLSLMSQYNPAYRAREFPEINRELTRDEWRKVRKIVENLGFKSGWVQYDGAAENLNPNFEEKNPFNNP